MSRLGSGVTGGGSLPTATDSVPTAAGVCAPFPGQFIKDAASYLTGQESLLTAAEAPACDVGPFFYQETFPGGLVTAPPTPVEVTSPDATITRIIDIPSLPAIPLKLTITGAGSCQEDLSGAMTYTLKALLCAASSTDPNADAFGRMYCNTVRATHIADPPPPPVACTFYDSATPPSGDAFLVFTPPAGLAYLYVCGAFNFVNFNEWSMKLVNFTVTIEPA